jgi:RNA polymerase sigma factor (TIGR02999 family)
MPTQPAASSGTVPPERGAVTALLERARAGDHEAASSLVPLVYGDLKRAAERLLGRERPDHTLRPTELVHEAYIRLVPGGAGGAESRAHFIAIAARAMRQVLVDHARRRAADKRGGGLEVRVTNPDAAMEVDVAELVALDDALERLGRRNERLPRVVELRFFAGLTEDETARALGVTPRTVQRDWATARAWLHKELSARSDG